MLVIRREQLNAFNQEAMRAFENELVRHAHEFAQHHCKMLGDDGVMRVVQYASRRAQQFHLTYRGPIRLYLELVFMLGSAFDTDPLLPWAGTILNDPTIDDQMLRAERLYNATNEYLDRVNGPDNVYALNALRALGAARVRHESSGRSYDAAALIDELRAAYPEKCDYAGEPGLQAMVGRATDLAKAHGLANDDGYALFTVLTFIAGHGFVDDPCLPWISRTLQDARITDPERRLAHFKSRCFTYLDHVLANLGLT